MYRFNATTINLTDVLLKFKYNKCIGSIILFAPALNRANRFKYNKCIGSIVISGVYSYAIKRFKYNKCIGSIVEHNSSGYFCTEFKYNKCIGSIHAVTSSILPSIDLNTTNVSVQLPKPLDLLLSALI